MWLIVFSPNGLGLAPRASASAQYSGPRRKRQAVCPPPGVAVGASVIVLLLFLLFSLFPVTHWPGNFAMAPKAEIPEAPGRAGGKRASGERPQPRQRPAGRRLCPAWSLQVFRGIGEWAGQSRRTVWKRRAFLLNETESRGWALTALCLADPTPCPSR